ncbi:transglycosylase family protein [Streptomyces sp. NPDC052682]|uniref:transglycosylase family protein n=1 Tax=Streptomyces sp. NPDC052682 TaxID=3154954 RepID=UPI003443A4FF
MLSGNGRHRRPRQAPALLVAAGVTGSAIAIPLLGATGASAADGTTWDRVADCETGGAWSQNSGNGLYGGLQLSQEDWEKHGGLDYAASPDLASRNQQIAVAERVLADEGVGVWRTCGLLAGLDKDSASADIDTGVAGDSSPKAAESSDSRDSSGLSDSSESFRSSASPDSASPDAPAPSTSSDAPSGTEGDAPHIDGSSADTSHSGDSGNSSRAGGPSALAGTDAEAAPAGTGRHRGPSAEETPAPGSTAGEGGRHASRGDAAARDAVDGSYTVRTGDSLSSIADSLDLGGGWHALYAANERTVGADPDLILPGQTLAIGVEPGQKNP